MNFNSIITLWLCGSELNQDSKFWFLFSRRVNSSDVIELRSYLELPLNIFVLKGKVKYKNARQRPLFVSRIYKFMERALLSTPIHCLVQETCTFRLKNINSKLDNFTRCYKRSVHTKKCNASKRKQSENEWRFWWPA